MKFTKSDQRKFRNLCMKAQRAGFAKHLLANAVYFWMMRQLVDNGTATENCGLTVNTAEFVHAVAEGIVGFHMDAANSDQSREAGEAAAVVLMRSIGKTMTKMEPPNKLATEKMRKLSVEETIGEQKTVN